MGQRDSTRAEGACDLNECIDLIKRERALAEVVHRDTKDLLVRTMSTLVLKRDLHMLANRKYKRRYYCFMAPTLIFSAAITCIQLTWPVSGLGGVHSSTIVAILAAINTVLIALTQMFEFQSLKDAHLTAGKAFDSLKDKQWSMSIKIASSLGRVRIPRSVDYLEEKNRVAEEVESLSNMISGKIEEISQIVPPIPDWIEVIGKAHHEKVLLEIQKEMGMWRQTSRADVSIPEEKSEGRAGLRQPMKAMRSNWVSPQSDQESPSLPSMTAVPSSSAAAACAP